MLQLSQADDLSRILNDVWKLEVGKTCELGNGFKPLRFSNPETIFDPLNKQCYYNNNLKFLIKKTWDNRAYINPFIIKWVTTSTTNENQHHKKRFTKFFYSDFLLRFFRNLTNNQTGSLDNVWTFKGCRSIYEYIRPWTFPLYNY